MTGSEDGVVWAAATMTPCAIVDYVLKVCARERTIIFVGQFENFFNFFFSILSSGGMARAMPEDMVDGVPLATKVACVVDQNARGMESVFRAWGPSLDRP